MKILKKWVAIVDENIDVESLQLLKWEFSFRGKKEYNMGTN